MTVTLGWEPPEFAIPLPRIGHYLFGLRAPDPWPEGVAIELRFYQTSGPADDDEPLVWTAQLNGDLAQWHATPEQVAAVRDAQARHVWLVYTNTEGVPLEWMRGMAYVP